MTVTRKKAKKTATKPRASKSPPKLDFPVICAKCGGNIEHSGVLAETGLHCIYCP